MKKVLVLSAWIITIIITIGNFVSHRRKYVGGN